MKELTAEILRELLDYDPQSGGFRRRKSQRCIRAGDVAGVNRADRYRVIKINKKRYLAHRLAWLHANGSWPINCIDHINGDPSDNRIANLRDIPALVNSQNLRRAHADNRSCGLLGASWHSRAARWQAHIRLDGKGRYLGLFDTAEAAHAAYLAAKRQHHEGCTL